MRSKSKYLCVFAGALLPALVAVTNVAAKDNNAGGGGSGYADCMNGCWRSHRYCKDHQSGQIDCDHQLGQCIEWCESTYDPQIRSPGAVFSGGRLKRSGS